MKLRSLVVLMATPVIAFATATIASAPAAVAAIPTFTVAENTPVSAVPATFTGFSIDPANLCAVVSLAQASPSFLQLFRNVGAGTFRVGGNTGDTKAAWSTTGTASCVWNKLVVTPALVDSFFAFAQSVGYRVMWQVPLNNGNLPSDAAEAAYAAAEPGIYSVEFGNEPNYYPNSSTAYQAYINNWQTTDQDYLADGGTAPVTGPAVTTSDSFYITPFLNQHASQIIADTGHYYVASSKRSPTPTCTDLVPIAGAVASVTAGVSQATSHGLPFIMNETNSFSSGGVNGSSNAFCEALWSASYGMVALNAGAQGLYFHGVANYPNGNSAGTANYYSPINADGSAAPEYYGVLFYNQMTKDGGSNVRVSGTATNIEAYAVKSPTSLHVAMVNRNATAQTVNLNTTNQYGQASSIALSGSSLTSKTDTTLGGSAAAADGTWQPSAVTRVALTAGANATVTIPAYTALIVSYDSTVSTDTTPPTTPGDGTISTTVGSSSEIDLSWAASTDDTAVTSYAITRTGGSGGPVTATVPSPTTTYNDKNLSASTTYTYSVTASDAAGNVSAAATASDTTQAAPPPPPVTQYVGNQSLETNLTGWTGVYSSGSKNTRAAGGYDGSYSLRSVNGTSVTNTTGVIDKPHWIDGSAGKATVAGRVYTGSGQVKADYAGEKISLFLRELNSAGTVMNDSAHKNAITVTAAGTGWFNITDAYPAKASGDSISYYVYSTATAGKGFNADLLSLTAPN